MVYLPSLRALRAFEAAARTLSFTKAAQELHLTHGAISRQIGALEESLAVRLFERTNRGIKLTPQGYSYLKDVSNALDRLRAATLRLSQQSGEWTVRLSVPHTFALWWLIPRLPAMQRELPKLAIDLSISFDPPRFDAEGHDAAIRRILRPQPGTFATRFVDARSVPVCSPEYARELRLRTPSDLKRATMIVYALEAEAWTEWLEKRAATFPKGVPMLKFDQLYLAIQAATASLGVAIAPYALVVQEVERGKLVFPFAVDARQGAHYALIHPKRAAKQEALNALATWLVKSGALPP